MAEPSDVFTITMLSQMPLEILSKERCHSVTRNVENEVIVYLIIWYPNVGVMDKRSLSR